jgi:hypothetical protein
MATIKNAYKDYQTKKLLEARVGLLNRGVYPFDVFLKEGAETIAAAEKIELLEEVADKYKAKVPTLYMFVKQNTSVIMESKPSLSGIKATMINYAFICEALNVRVNEAVKLLSAKLPRTTSLHASYKQDGVSLLEFCMKKSTAYSLMEGNAEPVVRYLAKELSRLSISELTSLCESVPKMHLYVSNDLHTELAQSVIGS